MLSAKYLSMKVCVLALLATSLLLASDKLQLANALKAQTDFERVELAPRPRIPDAEACSQSHAAALSVSLPEDQPLLRYRKGYCAFASAAATGDSRQFLTAAAEFDKAIDAWPARVRKSGKRAPPEPVPAALRVFAAIARLQASTGEAVTDPARQEIAAALQSPLKERFLEEYRRRLADAYRPRTDGKTLHRFLRLFLVAFPTYGYPRRDGRDARSLPQDRYLLPVLP